MALRRLVDGLPFSRSPLARRLAGGGFWSLVGEAGTRALTFITTIVVARALGVADLGAFAVVQGTIGMMMTVAQFGMGLTSTRYIAACRDSEPHRVEGIAGLTLSFSAATGLVCALSLFVLAPHVARDLLNAPALEVPLRIVAPIVMFQALSGALNGIVLGFEAFQSIARLVWLTSALSFVAVVAGVLIGGLDGAVVGLLVGETARFALIGRLAHGVMRARGFRLLARPTLGEAPLLWRFSLPLLLGSLLHAPVLWACQAMVFRQAGGMSAIGLYDVSQKLMTIVILVPLAASAAFAPVLANLSGGGAHGAIRRTTLRLAAVQLALTALPAVLVALLASQVLLLFGAGFVDAAPVVQVMMLLAPVFVLKHLYWQSLTGQGRAWTAFWLALLWAAVALTATWLWRGDGASGLAWAMLNAYGASLVASIVVVEWRSLDPGARHRKN